MKFISSTKIVSASNDSTIAVWDWQVSETPSVVLRGHSEVVLDVAWSRDCTRLFSISWDQTLKVWNMTGGPAIGTFPLGKGTCHMLSRHGGFAAIYNNHNVRVLNVDSVREGKKALVTQWKRSCTAVAFSENATHFAFSSSNGNIEVKRAGSWAKVLEVKACGNQVQCLDFSQDLHLFVSGNSAVEFKKWTICWRGANHRSYCLYNSVQPKLGTPGIL